jgi:predicted  nucleic acid-binding Zn-ribbon protein
MLTKEYKAETGEPALYSKDGSYYHTLRYVRWLETRFEKAESELAAANQKLKDQDEGLEACQDDLAAEREKNKRLRELLEEWMVF